MRYASLHNWAKYFQEQEGVKVGEKYISNRLEEAGRVGIFVRTSVSGILVNLFSEVDIRETCTKVLNPNFPQADESGFFEKEGVLYASAEGWSRYFWDKEGILITAITIRKRLKRSEKVGISARDGGGVMRQNSYFSEEEVRSVCSDKLEKIPQADESGFFEQNGELFGTITSWSRKLEVSTRMIIVRLEDAEGVKPLKGMVKAGNLSKFYSETDIEKVCPELFAVLPCADKSGFFESEGLVYGTPKAWCKKYELPSKKFKDELKKVKSIKGRIAKGGSIRKFYAQPQIQAIRNMFQQKMNRKKESIFYEMDGVRYATIGCWIKELRLTGPAVVPRVKKSGIESIKLKSKMGHLRDYYSEPDIRSACADLLEELPQADESGLIQVNGAVYGTKASWSKVLKLQDGTIGKRLARVKTQPIEGRTAEGKRCKFYEEGVVRKVCGDLIGDFPQAGEGHILMIEGIRHSTITRWAGILEIDGGTIKRRIASTAIKGITARDTTGQIRKNAFFSEDDVRKFCADIIHTDLLSADETGFFEKDGIRYGTTGVWARFLNKPVHKVQSCLKKSKVEPIKGKTVNGIRHDFYPEAEVRRAYAINYPDLPEADEDGFIELGGEKYGCMEGWACLLPISTSPIKDKIEKCKLNSVKGRDRGGHIIDFYSETDIRLACADLLEDIVELDQYGFANIGGDKYGTAKAWSETISVADCTVRSYLKKNKIPSRKGKSKRGGAVAIYSEADVLRVCEHLINPDIPQADTNGFFQKDTIRYGTLRGLGKLFGISDSEIKKRAIDSGIKPIRGKTVVGQVFHFYPESETKLVCDELLVKMPKADKDGFIEVDGIRYGTKDSLAKWFGLYPQPVALRIRRSDIQFIKGKSKSGRVLNFFPEPEVRVLCADLLEKRSNPHAS